ncbi:MAG: hypothetical protein RJA70_1302 [Pseudomonadota bacterium]|jgi:hypothetical protein
MNRKRFALLLTLLVGACGRDRIDLTTGTQVVGAAQNPEQGGASAQPSATTEPLAPNDPAPSSVVEAPSPEAGSGASPAPVDAGRGHHGRPDAGHAELTPCAPGIPCPSDLPLCDPNRGVCFQCFTSRDCIDGDYCSDEGRCVSGCDSDRDCGPSKPECHHHRCVECKSSFECVIAHGLTRAFCDRHTCRACERDEECHPDFFCSAGECRPM